MLKISQQQISERWDVLPTSLREALYSPEYGEIIWQIGAKHYLDEGKIGKIAALVGYIVYGFIHLDDLTRNIKEELNLNPEIANIIAREIDRKIFSPVRDDIEKIYKPVPELPETELKIKPKPAPEPASPPPPPIEPKTPFKPSAPPPPAELPIAGPTEPKPTPLTELPKIPKTPETPLKPTSELKEIPFIIHEETKPKAVAEKKPFSFPAIGWFKKTPAASQQEKPITEKPVKVELETFEAAPSSGETATGRQGKEPPLAKTEPPKQKVIHYREAGPATPFGNIQEKPPEQSPEQTPSRFPQTAPAKKTQTPPPVTPTVPTATPPVAPPPPAPPRTEPPTVTPITPQTTPPQKPPEVIKFDDFEVFNNKNDDNKK